MTYTGEDSDTSGVNIQEIGYRALTESHGATAPLYRAFSGGTSDDVGSPPTGNWQPTRHRKQQNKRAENIAKREHIARLLRNCRKLVESLKRSDDRTELAQTGSMLCDMLDEIWQY